MPTKNSSHIKISNPSGEIGVIEISGVAVLIAVIIIIFIAFLIFFGEVVTSSQLPQAATAAPTPSPTIVFTPGAPAPTPTRIPIDGQTFENGQPISGNTAVFFIADKSRSMEYDGKIEREREIIENLAKQLNPNDVFSVIGFDATVFVVVRPTKISELLPVLKYRLGNLVAMGKTDLLPAMVQACRFAEVTKATHLHIIVMSDGKIPIVGDEFLTALKCFTKLSGKVTALGIGDETDDPFLEMLSKYGNGITFKAVNSSETVERLISFIKKGHE